MQLTYVPDPTKADGQIGTGSNLVPVFNQDMEITYVPNPNAADGASGGGTGGASDYIDYAGPPILTPPDLAHIIVDVNGQQWQYFQGGWN